MSVEWITTGPRNNLFGKMAAGTRSRGRPKQRWKDCVKQDLKICGIGENWYKETADWDGWRNSLRQGKALAEKKLAENAETRRRPQHDRQENRVSSCRQRQGLQ